MGLIGMRLLVLEDEYLIGLELERIAEECGARSVHLVSTVDELLGWIDSDAVCDIAILEVQARGLSSLEAAFLLQQSGIPIVFTTAYDQQLSGITGFPGVPVVEKPYGKTQILQAVRLALGANQLAPKQNGPSGELV
ncbi:response regulator [Phyllobacterium sp. A18/5-2]|jgi:CheY-like chemotaxis protein|uniref:response regulator n=1 Tax=Phyllobacterium sp. A18/5-2 TaxID=2978392 RepID=UPI000DDCA7B3|nr:response regulator [Phyllobacterium sp. A18/5-2]UXN65189.1 response regulator [Phyllobacterium sp. A18/5-2]